MRFLLFIYEKIYFLNILPYLFSINYFFMINRAINIKMLIEYLKFGIFKTIINSYYIIYTFREWNAQFSRRRQWSAYGV